MFKLTGYNSYDHGYVGGVDKNGSSYGYAQFDQNVGSIVLQTGITSSETDADVQYEGYIVDKYNLSMMTLPNGEYSGSAFLDVITNSVASDVFGGYGVSVVRGTALPISSITICLDFRLLEFCYTYSPASKVASAGVALNAFAQGQQGASKELADAVAGYGSIKTRSHNSVSGGMHATMNNSIGPLVVGDDTSYVLIEGRIDCAAERNTNSNNWRGTIQSQLATYQRVFIELCKRS